jgi:hypothetical protein
MTRARQPKRTALERLASEARFEEPLAISGEPESSYSLLRDSLELMKEWNFYDGKPPKCGRVKPRPAMS